ncbi:hypothetical protein [Roseovarius sp. M141]|uniref:hypothetical protein n=1 Tax=Roseovarius sp. M141 TaxID=2583806 RepID=UPI0020CC7518|nr:hypothetical protein [Roseovarius sp. M141]MCQ0090830.1 hypothetical protein [Roseovarius sp. M141]
MPTYRALAIFRGLLFLGLLLNAAFFVPGLFAPRVLEGWFDFGITNTVHWLQNVSLLLIIVTAMYIPVMRDPFRYIFITYLAVGGRFAAGTLFLWGVWFMDYPQGVMTLALGDLTLSSVQAFVLYRVLQDGDPDAGWS